jgi:putative DNA primase/helicase
MTVAASQRYTRDRPCPICGGSERDPRGRGRRCIGFLSSDGDYARCSREEHAGALLPDDTGAYVHRLAGDCHCGHEHGDTNPARGAGRTGPGEVIATYPYRDEAGVDLFQVVRTADKRFFQRRHVGGGRFESGLEGTRRVLYRLPELLAAPIAAPVWVVEGEKDVDNLRAAGLVSTTSPGGAGKWPPEYGEVLRGRRVVILPDNDDPGRKHASEVATALGGRAASVRVLELHGLPPKGDVSDWLAAGHSAAELIALAETAPEAAAWPRSAERALVPPRAADKRASARVVRVADVTPEAVTWLWDGRIPLGKITVLDGDPGLGKSTMLADLAARLSTGRPFPGEETGCAPASVLFIAHEDGIADTLRPRLDAAGADTTRIHVLEGFADDSESVRLPSIPGDLASLENVINEHAVRLVVIDPLYAYLNSGTDSYSDHDVRSALAPLGAMATRTGAAVVLVRHLRKAGGASAIYRGGGSIGIIGIARAGLLLARDPEDENARVVACVKANLGPPPVSLAWRFAGGTPPRVDWTGESKHSADTLVNVELEAADERSAGEEARSFLQATLEPGPLLTTEVFKQAKQAGIAEKTLRRAKAALGVEVHKTSFSGKWEWELPKVPLSARGPSWGQRPAAGPPNHVNGNNFPQGGQDGHSQDGQTALATLAEVEI